MKVVMVGAGYVGLVTGACFSEFGFEVTCVDQDPAKLARLEAGDIPIYEPGLDDLVARNVEAGRLSFTASLAEAVKGVDVVFIAVGTPSRRGDGHADLTYVYAAAAEIADALDGPAVVVTKSTVPVGTGQEVARIFAERRPDLAVEVVSNPEFLREGSAIEDFMRPDRVVIGAEGERGREVMRALYRPLFLRDTPIVFTDRATAEIIKYAANAFLAMKITFINEMADLCEKVGGDVQDVARGIGLDKRIAPKFLHPGPGYGGSCFPKDTLALTRTARDAGAPSRIVEAVVAVNEARKASMAERILAMLDRPADGAVIGILGLAFKPNTDDMRDAPSLAIVPALLEAGCRVRVFDPAAMQAARPLLGEGPDWCRDAYDAAQGADVVAIVTEWNEFRALDLARLKSVMRQPAMIDLRNVYAPDHVVDAGFAYAGVGRGRVPPIRDRQGTSR